MVEMFPILALLVLNAVSAAYLIGYFRAGIDVPERRRWPPGQLTRRSVLEIWGVSSVVFVTAYALGAVDAGRVGWPDWVRYGLGVPFLVLGTVCVSLGMARLGIARSSGAAGDLVSSGIYGFIRHPQYLGHATALTGWLLYTASLWSIPAIFAAFVCMYYATQAEERWLALRHGERHCAYVRRTDRLR